MTLIEQMSEPVTASDDFSIPLCIDDIISICKDFSNLGIGVQSQIEDILELGVEESIRMGKVQRKYLPCIRFFLNRVVANPYFGEAASQAKDCLQLIYLFEERHKEASSLLN